MPNVAFKRPELVARLPEYQLVRDAIAGEPAVKSATTKYLPKPNAEDRGAGNNARYKAYTTRAVFYGVTGRTVGGLVGQMFNKPPLVKVPTAMALLVEDVSGEGVGIVQLAKKVANWVLPYGRSGLFVDYPDTAGEDTTKAELEDGEIRPIVKAYEPWAIINWRWKRRGALKVLSLVVLEETYIDKDDGFEIKHEQEWRVLKLVPNGLGGDHYTVEVWRREATKNFFLFSTVVPVNSAGQPFNDIPFCFIGSENNDSDIDPTELYDLASINMAHYRNSADYEESCFICGQPTPVVTGLTEAWADKYFKEGVALGSRSAVPLPAGGDFKLEQPVPNSMPFEAMEHKERQMVALGAKLVEQKTVQRTATEAGQEEASETSILSTIADNISLAFEWALGWCAEYQGVTPSVEDGIVFKLETDYALSTMSPEEQTAVMSAWQQEAIAFSEMRARFRKTGLATLTDAEALTEIKAAMPTLGRAAVMPDDEDELDEDGNVKEKTPPAKPGGEAGNTEK